MKKRIICAISILFVLCLAGCGGQTISESVVPSNQREEVTIENVDKKDEQTDEGMSSFGQLRDRTIPFEGIDIVLSYCDNDEEN
ncbi:MAG: hypothetical protein MJ092_08385, partial [Lachnospiraceae bacterium]|nr:hypothetical protein [Lachnospiraceae bacterium]